MQQRTSSASAALMAATAAVRSPTSPPRSCPLADFTARTVDAAFASDAPSCPFHGVKHSKSPGEKNVVDTSNLQHTRLFIDRHGDYDRTPESAALLASIGGGRRIRELTTRFYSYAMQDAHLKEFFFMDDGVEMAAERLGTWLIQFMGGEGNPWDDLGREGKRQESHARAWFSSKRPRERQGRRFKLDDCRVWMRLMFLSARDIGLMDAPAAPFMRWFVQFIAHFIRIYEVSAPPFAAIDAQWGADPSAVDAYFANGRIMRDVVGVLHASSSSSTRE